MIKCKHYQRKYMCGLCLLEETDNLAYTRYPWYIWSNGEELFFSKEEAFGSTVPEEAINLFLHTLVEERPEELKERVEKGKQIAQQV